MPLTTFTWVGYQPTGMNPSDFDLPKSSTSKTAKQLLSAFAMYNFSSSSDRAMPLVDEPSNEFGNKAAFKTSISFPFSRSITETELSFALATKRVFPFFVKTISFG